MLVRRAPPVPALVEALRQGYSMGDLAGDLIAGVTVGLVALPLAMAFAIASGLPPQNGIYCAVVAGFVISALGGSRTQIGGPTGAFVVVVAGIVAAHGLDGLFMCTLMAGVILILLGVTGMGTAVKFIPRPVVIGFTNGIAVLIASTQIRDLFGLRTGGIPGDFLGRLRMLAAHADTASVTATLFGARRRSRAILILRRVSRRIPGSIFVLLAGSQRRWRSPAPRDHRHRDSAACPAGCPLPRCPRSDSTILHAAVARADRRDARRHRVAALGGGIRPHVRRSPRSERRTDGAGNRQLLSPLFGGLPATGAIARTATNIRSGARTPIAGMTHARHAARCAARWQRRWPVTSRSRFWPASYDRAYDMGEWREIPDAVKLGAGRDRPCGSSPLA